MFSILLRGLCDDVPHPNWVGHNCPAPSAADIKVTRDLIRAGQLMKTDVLDHIIAGPGCFANS